MIVGGEIFSDLQTAIIRDYFSNPNQTIKQIGEKHGVSLSRVGRILERGLRLKGIERDQLLNSKIL